MGFNEENLQSDSGLIWSVNSAGAGFRVDKVVAEKLPDFSRNSVQRLILEGAVKVNGEPVRRSLILKEGDRVEVYFPPPQESTLIPQSLPVKFIYEDQDMLVVDKPRGMVVHPGPGHSSGTLVNALLYYCRDLSGIGGELRPGIVHRLDKDTSGLLVVAKNDSSHRELSRQLQEKQMDREYLVLVWGKPKSRQFTVSAPIARHPKNRKKMTVISTGKEAVTHFRVLSFLPSCSLLRAALETGRTHQVRVHLAYTGFAVVGDLLYGGHRKELDKIKWEGQALHSRRINLMHPQTGRAMTFTSPLPKEFRFLLKYLRGFQVH